jgi:hypothetical protein
VRIVSVISLVIVSASLACASLPDAGPLADDGSAYPRITQVDTSRPPQSVWVDLDQQGYAAVVLVAPGHSATLLYPADSTTSNTLSRGTHHLPFTIPDLLVAVDSNRYSDRVRRGPPGDSSIRTPGRQPSDTLGRPRVTRMNPLSPTTPTYLLLVTSSKPLVYQRLLEKTVGVSIPTVEMEALNAVAKAIKSTIATEPRDLSGYFQRVELRRRS